MRLRLKQQRLIELLAASGLSQNHWALRIGVARGHWSEIVNGKHPYPSAKTRVLMLEALKVPLEELFEVETGIDPVADVDFRRAISDRYIIDAELGQGGMGAVYLARDVRHGRVVAVKVISPEAVSGIGINQFHREISTVAQLHHQNILPLFDSGDAAGHPFYVMPWVRGGSLRARLQRDVRLDLPSTLRLTRGMADALHHAHGERILHCDVKPENVLLNGDHAWVMDFGIARKLHSEIGEWPLRKELDISAGTPAYVSPEQASGDPDLDARSDVYSLGCMVYEMLAGRTPFGGTSTQEIVATRFIVPPPALSAFAPEVPASVTSVLERAMALPRDHRPETPAAFATELEEAAANASRIISAASLTASRAISKARRRMHRTAPHTVGGFVLDLVRDIRLTSRSLRARPAFTATVAVTLALGIGANAAMFGILDRLLFRAPPHIADPDRIVQIHTRWLGSESVQTTLPYQVYRDLLDGVSGFESIAVSTPTTINTRAYYPLGRGAAATRIAGAQVSPSFFTTLGVRPQLGRFFQEDEAGENNPQKLAVIGHGFWRRRGGRSDIIGQTLDLGADRYTIVGVAPAGFTGPELSDVDVWIPIAAADGLRFVKGSDWRTTRQSQWLQIHARLAPNANRQQALNQATAAIRRGEAMRIAESRGRGRQNPDSLEVLFGSVIPGKSLRSFGLSSSSGEFRVSKLLAGVSFMVLLLACANVANLLLVRALNRRREIAVRLALGISRRRLVGQLLLEGIVLAMLGALGALAIVYFGSGFIRRLLLADAAWTGNAVDGRVLLFTAIAAIVTGLLISLVPALQASNPDITNSLKAGVREGGGTRSRTRSVLLATQAALALILLAGAGLFVRSLQRVAALPFGVDIDRVLVASIEHTSVGLTNAQAKELHVRFAERAREVPGVTGAAVSIAHTFGLGWGVRVYSSGQNLTDPSFEQGFSQYAITPDYFSVMGVRLITGRTFDERDREGSALVAILNETAARKFWPNGNAVGQCVQVDADTVPCTTIVGVVSNARRQQLVEGPIPQLYRPLDQLPPRVTDRTVSFFGYTLLMRTSRPPAGLVEPVRRALQSVAVTVPYVHVRPLGQQLARHTRSWTLGATMFSIFGGLALVLAVVGLYSVVVFNLAQRLHEYGVRRALGATSGHLVRITMTRGVLPVVLGILVGGAIAFASARFISALLFETSARDPMVLGGAVVVLLAAALVASFVPSLRATKSDPMTALRAE